MNKKFATAYDQNPSRRSIIAKRKRGQKIMAVPFFVGFHAVIGTMAAYLGIS